MRLADIAEASEAVDMTANAIDKLMPKAFFGSGTPSVRPILASLVQLSITAAMEKRDKQEALMRSAATLIAKAK